MVVRSDLIDALETLDLCHHRRFFLQSVAGEVPLDRLDADLELALVRGQEVVNALGRAVRRRDRYILALHPIGDHRGRESQPHLRGQQLRVLLALFGVRLARDVRRDGAVEQ